MGRAKQQWMEEQELEPMYDWIEDHYGLVDDTDPEWADAVEAYERHVQAEIAKYELYEAEWESQLQTFIDSNSDEARMCFQQFDSISNLSNLEMYGDESFVVNVMQYGSVISSLESYLASRIIGIVTHSEEYMKNLIETTAHFKKKSFKLSEYYSVQKTIKLEVANYLHKEIFHRLDTVIPMYKNTLNVEFGEVDWLGNAIAMRHDCIHRMGHDKDGKRVELNWQIIDKLILQCRQLIAHIERQLPEDTKPNRDLEEIKF